MIKIEHLSRRFSGQKVLDDVNLVVEDGEIYGLVGASGAGKSTLLDCINGLTAYEHGSVTVDGVKVELLKERELRNLRKNVGMIFQNFSLLSRKTVYQNIALPMECWGIKKNEIEKRVVELAELVGLTDKLAVRPDSLSGGQKQRVAIARALTMRPKYLLCDECTSALDPKTTGDILNLLGNVRQEMGITILMVTHEMSVVQRLCDRMSLLEAGRISESGKVVDLFLHKSAALKKLLGEQTAGIPETGAAITFTLSSDMVDRPVLWEVSREIQGKYSLVNSEFYYFQAEKYCSITIRVEEDDRMAAEYYLRSQGIVCRISNEEADNVS